MKIVLINRVLDIIAILLYIEVFYGLKTVLEGGLKSGLKVGVSLWLTFPGLFLIT